MELFRFHLHVRKSLWKPLEEEVVVEMLIKLLEQMRVWAVVAEEVPILVKL